ncbi:vancomycin permeability regulator SanA [Nocardiopsis sp. Huas11]|uniref:SanA/YdcF family protein n=1 Tax=Nocardiopsis sp. Huas11 TaxID=2183912 RepID=UPI000EB365B5|nr:ElyC/SanA/YdcF family protein [Nocardiopsis sp. Huas11]RKS10416.1 vancomycin permeability regulator SanA [Nocardiopsis sp. Huas11]
MTTSDPGIPETDRDDARRPAAGTRARRRVRLVAAVAVAAVLLAFLPFVWTLASTAEHRHTADAVPDRPVALVLGAGVRQDGQPTLLLARRLDTAAELYFDERVSVILVTGDNSVEHYNETDTMAEYLVAAGVPADRIVGDYAGFSTWESCVRAREVFGVREATVVTQDFHLPRAVRLCRSAGIDAVGVADSSLRDRTFATVYGWLREVPAAVAAAGTVLLRPDPTFLGDEESGVQDALAGDGTDTGRD